MSARYRDFDAMIRERQSVEPVSFQWAGEVYVLPAELPALVGLLAIRLQSESGSEAEVAGNDVFTAFKAILGDAQYEKLIASGISFTALMEIFEWVMKQYQPGSNDEGNATAPA